MTTYASIQKINGELDAASQAQRNTDKGVKAPDPKKLSALTTQREELYRDVVKQFLNVYFAPSLVFNGEPVLAAMYRLTGGEGRYRRELCGPIMDALVGYEIGFTEQGDLVLMHDGSIAQACDALGFKSEVAPDWAVTDLPTGQKVLRKKG